MISLGGVDLDNNLHLIGFETDPDINYSMRQTLGGNLVIQTHPRNAGTSLKLVAENDGSSKMGKFCSHQIDALKALAATGNTFDLIHPAKVDPIKVKIFEFDVIQSDKREQPDPNKKWHGEILLQEV